MQDPNEDTQWNDVLRSKGIIPPKDNEINITEDEITDMIENAVKEKSGDKALEDMTLDELDEVEDDIDEEEERLFEEYKRKRLQELKALQARSKFGTVLEITKADFVEQVNKAGDGVWVVVHVYKDSIPLCKLLNQHLSCLARKFPETKFVKSISNLCIPNYPDKHLPTVFVYYEDELKKQYVGPLHFGGMNLKQDELEWIISESGAIKTTLAEPPRKKVHDIMESSIRGSNINNTNSDDEDDY